MTINQDTANLIDTLASAAAKLSFTDAGRQIEAQIIAMIPGAADNVAESLRQDNIELQTSGRIMAENLEILRDRLAKIAELTNSLLVIQLDRHLVSDLERIASLAKPIED